MSATLGKFGKIAKDNTILLVLLGLVFLLRLPSLFEPLWYGDESIYLTIGQQLLRGDILYLDIFDHKTPGIYYLTGFALKTLGSSVWSLHFLTLLWSALTTVVFFVLAKGLFDRRVASLASVFFVALTATPILEGNIASSELMMILPICLGLLFGLKNRFFLSGFFFSLAFLLKVPAVFDFAAFFLFVALTLETSNLKASLRKLILLLAGFSLPVAISCFYFAFQGGLQDYFYSAFLYNVAYTGYKNTFLFSNSLLFFKALPLMLLVGFYILRSLKEVKNKGKATPSYVDFLVLWFAFSFYGAALGGRTYNHYLLQIVPAFSLLLSYLFYEKGKRYFISFLVFVASLVLLLGFRPLISPSYYTNFVGFVSGSLSFEDYASSFDKKTPRNYALAGFLKEKTSAKDSLYLFSQQADIYFLSGLNPASRFITFYHVNNTPNGKEETAQEIAAAKPKYILVDEPPPGSFPQLENILNRDYNLFAFQEDVRIYKISKLAEE